MKVPWHPHQRRHCTHNESLPDTYEQILYVRQYFITESLVCSSQREREEEFLWVQMAYCKHQKFLMQVTSTLPLDERLHKDGEMVFTVVLIRKFTITVL